MSIRKRIGWWVDTLLTDSSWWKRLWLRLQHRCFMCEERPMSYGPKYGQQFVCTECADKLMGRWNE